MGTRVGQVCGEATKRYGSVSDGVLVGSWG